MRVLAELAVHALQAHGVCDFPDRQAGLVQNGDDALMCLLHEIHDDLVIKVVDLCAKKS